MEMAEYTLFGFQVEIDGAATRAWYAGAEEWGCECGDCRNFLKLARGRSLPAPGLELLDRFGIPPEKATYVCHLSTVEGGHLYEFSYRLAGSILSGDEKTLASLDGGNGWCYHEPYPYGAPGFPEPHFDLGFWITLPWVLEAPRK